MIGDAGNATAALGFAGTVSPNQQCESWNGTSWTEVGDLNTARYLLAGSGTYTSTLAYGGTPGSGATGSGNTESWNGSAWTTGADLNAGRYNWGGIGSDNTTALAAET